MIRFRRTTGDTPEPRGDAALERDLLALYAAPVPSLTFAAPVPEPTTRHPRAARFRRPALAAVAIGVVAAAVISLPNLWGGTTQAVNADQIFQLASDTASASAAHTSYHFIASSTVGKGASSTTETWSRDASHFRNQSDDTGVSFDGDQMWLWANLDGVVHAVHAVHGAAEITGNDAKPTTLAEMFGQFGDSECQQATREVDSTVAGRDAYVVDIAPKASCPKLKGMDAKAAGSMRVWIDKLTFVTLKTEASDPTGVVYTYEVTEFESGIAIPDSAFEYHAPAGVQVAEVASASDAKLALVGGADNAKGDSKGDAVAQEEKRSAANASGRPVPLPGQP